MFFEIPAHKSPWLLDPYSNLIFTNHFWIVRACDFDFSIVSFETANKLVETRKSKVKVLVGAYESVISLQEKEKLLSNSITLKSDYSRTIH